MEAFAAARFATHPDGRIAARIDTHDASPWGASNTTPADGVEWYYDHEMAADGWSPLDESRAEKAEAALEDLREQYGTAVREKDEWEANAEAAEERLQVTDAMVARARESLRSDGWTVGEGSTSLRDALTAALTETPARPDGAEALVPTLRRLGETSKRWLGEFSDDDLDEFADALASEGVRVTEDGEDL